MDPEALNPDRDIRLLPPVEATLKRQMARTLLNGNYVFCNSAGGPHEVNNLRKRVWYPSLKKAGLRQRTLYQTRHTFATLMLSSGENPIWVAAMLGHSTAATLFKNYNRFIPNLTRQDGSAFMANFEKLKAFGALWEEKKERF